MRKMRVKRSKALLHHEAAECQTQAERLLTQAILRDQYGWFTDPDGILGLGKVSRLLLIERELGESHPDRTLQGCARELNAVADTAATTLWSDIRRMAGDKVKTDPYDDSIASCVAVLVALVVRYGGHIGPDPIED